MRTPHHLRLCKHVTPLTTIHTGNGQIQHQPYHCRLLQTHGCSDAQKAGARNNSRRRRHQRWFGCTACIDLPNPNPTVLQPRVLFVKIRPKQTPLGSNNNPLAVSLPTPTNPPIRPNPFFTSPIHQASATRAPYKALLGVFLGSDGVLCLFDAAVWQLATHMAEVAVVDHKHL